MRLAFFAQGSALSLRVLIFPIQRLNKNVIFLRAEKQQQSNFNSNLYPNKIATCNAFG